MGNKRRLLFEHLSMDQSTAVVVDRASFGSRTDGSRRSLVRRRPRTLALVTTAVLAPSVTMATTAFVPPTLNSVTTTPLVFARRAGQPAVPLVGNSAGPATRRCSADPQQRRRCLHALNMVSCLTVPTKTTASPSSRTHIVDRKTGYAKNNGRAVEIDLHPDPYAEVGFDDVALNCAKRNQCFDGVDSEILSQGITRASPLQKDPTIFPMSASANELLSVSTNINQQSKQGGNCEPTAMSQDSNYVANTTIKEKANRSSTMPGFIKNENLDTHIFQHELRSLTSPVARKHLRRSKGNTEAGRL